MTIYNLHSSVVDAHHSGAHILPPDGKDASDDDAEIFNFVPSLHGARLLNEKEVSLLQRSRVNLMQKPEKPLHCAGIIDNLLIASSDFVDLVEELCPGCHQAVPLQHVWFKRAKEPSPGRYFGLLIAGYTRTVDLERSNIYRKKLPQFELPVVLLTGATVSTRVVYAQAANRLPIWADDATGAVFCTESFRARVNGLPGLSGLEFLDCTEI